MGKKRPPTRFPKGLERSPLPRVPRNLRKREPVTAKFVSTETYQPDEQFDALQARASSLWDVSLPPGVSTADGFAVEYMTCDMGELILNSGYCAAHEMRRMARATQSPIDHWWLMRTNAGEARFEIGDRQMHARPGDMYLFSLDHGFRGALTEYDAVALALPRDALRSVAATLDDVSGTVLTGNLAGLLADYLSNLETRVANMLAEELVEAGHATVNMIAACIQPSRDRLHEARGAIEMVLFERARAYVQLNLGNPDLSPEHLMQELRISRSVLYRAFAHVDGVSHYIQRTRLHAARAALSEGTATRIQDVAYSHGFRNAADFTRAFRREFGYSPRAARNTSE